MLDGNLINKLNSVTRNSEGSNHNTGNVAKPGKGVSVDVAKAEAVAREIVAKIVKTACETLRAMAKTNTAFACSAIHNSNAQQAMSRTVEEKRPSVTNGHKTVDGNMTVRKLPIIARNQ